MLPATMIIPATNAGRSPKILKRMMLLPVRPVVSYRPNYVICKFRSTYQSVAIAALLGLKMRRPGSDPVFILNMEENSPKALIQRAETEGDD